MTADIIMNNNNENKKSTEDKQRQIKADAAIKAKPKCSICGKFKYDMPRCAGHGIDGGGHSSKGESGLSHDKTSTDAVSNTASVSSRHSHDASHEMNALDVSHHTVMDEKTFNQEVISELLSNKLLLINNDRNSGTLIVKLQCEPKFVTAEQSRELNKYVNIILNELEEFKKEHGISVECKDIKRDHDGNIQSLCITLPTPALYDAFIQRLTNKNLLPVQNAKQLENEKVAYPQGRNHFHANPLLMKPSLTAKRKSIKDESENGHKIPRPKSPLDGLKPKGSL